MRPEVQVSRRYLVDQTESVGKWQILSVMIKSSNTPASELKPEDDLNITIRYKCTQPLHKAHFQVSIWGEQGFLVTSADSRIGEFHGWDIDGEGEITCIFPSIPLISGRYFVRVYMLRSDIDWPLASFGWNDGRVCGFLIKPAAAKMSTGMVWYPTQSDYGIIKLAFQWHKEDTITRCDRWL